MRNPTCSLVLLFVASCAPPTAVTVRPVDIFAGLDGRWTGDFVGYDSSGRELYRIEVEQHYRTVDDHTQTVEISDRSADGTVVTGRGKNSAHRDADGELVLRCVVDKSNGDHVEHSGRVGRGPTGIEQLVWYSVDPAKVETFREWVVGTGAAATYYIHGMGRYGDSMVLMAGSYRRAN